MGTDEVAIAFASWVEAHKLYVAAERRLLEAERIAKQMGMLPPESLVKEVRELKGEADRLLAIAQVKLESRRGKNTT